MFGPRIGQAYATRKIRITLVLFVASLAMLDAEPLVVVALPELGEEGLEVLAHELSGRQSWRGW